ncbi:MAG TPA: cysteine desulfurase family protein, partial [bacterium]|nr:cysteine desulfurase family protein [bacterium]
MNRIYLDHNATTPADPEVVRAMLPYFSEKYGNASSIHFFGQQARNAVEEVRDSVARLIGAQYEEIYFTGGGTESDNLAVKGVCQAAKGKGNHIITSGIEHSAVLNTCRFLEGKGFEVTYLPVDEYGRVNPDDVRKAVRKTTVLITVMHANNEVGTIQPVAELGKIAQERDIPFHTDAVQSFGKLSVNAEKMNADLISVSGHKIHGPKGIGCIYIRKGIRIEPLMHGGHHEREKRAGTENVPGIIGLGKAAGLAAAKREEESLRLTGLREKLWNGIREKIPHVLLNGHPE